MDDRDDVEARLAAHVAEQRARLIDLAFEGLPTNPMMWSTRGDYVLPRDAR
jgi:hypothetical protein